jgi:hypothetical protein
MHDDEKVGRLYRMNGAPREQWRWTHFWYTRGPNGGVTDTLEEAKAAFRAKWEAWNSGRPPKVKPPEKRGGP